MKKEVTRLKHLALTSKDQFTLDPNTIVIEDGHNPRNYSLPENRAHLDNLKESIREHGVLQPLWVRYEAETKMAVLVDGECRLRATLELIEEGVEIQSIPAIQVPGGNEPDRLVLAMTANSSKPLSKWEAGIAFQRLQKFGWDDAKVAKRLGVTERYIKEAAELSDAPEEIKQLLSQQAVTPALALTHIRKSGSGAIITLRSSVASAQAKGKKTAKRSHQPSVNGLRPLMQTFFKDVDKEALANIEFESIDVPRKKLAKVWEFLN